MKQKHVSGGCLLHNLVEASFDLFRYLLLGDQLEPWELHPLVPYTSSMNLKLLWYHSLNIMRVVLSIHFEGVLPATVYTYAIMHDMLFLGFQLVA